MFPNATSIGPFCIAYLPIYLPDYASTACYDDRRLNALLSEKASCNDDCLLGFGFIFKKFADLTDQMLHLIPIAHGLMQGSFKGGSL